VPARPDDAHEAALIDGAEIRICEASLRAAKQDPAGLPDYLKLVASGAVELVRLQEAGFAYLRA
jgi:intracellular sulfur oxidation DsrE/DsrF family protein